MSRTDDAGRSRGRPEVERAEPDRREGRGPDPGIRPMRAGDLAAVAEIERRSFSEPWRESTFRRLLEADQARAWTADAGRVVGYVVLWRRGRGAQLGNLAVAPDARRSGIGRRLVRHALRAARTSGAEHLTLEVRESNRAALELYRGLGFRLLGRRDGYYRSPPEDALVLGVDTR